MLPILTKRQPRIIISNSSSSSNQGFLRRTRQLRQLRRLRGSAMLMTASWQTRFAA